jgi:hypothetical protein
VKATVKVDAARVVGKAGQFIFGHFIEHLGRCIYGGVLDERGGVGPRDRRPIRPGASFVHTFAPRSATVLEIPLAGSRRAS